MARETADSRAERIRVFLCHASEDKEKVRPLHRELQSAGVKPWLDEEDLIGGQEWEVEIPKEVHNSDVVLVCVSKSVNKRGYLQKEIRIVLDVADEQPPGTIFVIPVRLEDCAMHARLQKWQRIDLFAPAGYDRLLRALQHAAEQLGRKVPEGTWTQQVEQEQMSKVLEALPAEKAGTSDAADFDRRIEARLCFRDARGALDWKRAEVLVNEALTLDPSLKEARSWIALRLTEVVAEWFKDAHGYRELPSQPDMTPQYMLHGGAPLSEATAWVSAALEHDDDPDGRVSAALAVLHGAAGRFEHMVNALERAVGMTDEARPYLLRCGHLAMLAHACASLEQLRQVGEMLGFSLPVPIEAVRQSMENIKWESPSGSFVDWSVLEQSTAGLEPDGAKRPSELRIFRFPDEQGMMMGKALYLARGVVEREFPLLLVRDLLDQLDKRYLFVCLMHAQ